MSVIEVAKLTLRCPADRSAHTRFVIEDGLQASIPDDPRLILVQKMQVPGRVVSLHPTKRQSAIGQGWIAAISGARHGAQDGARSANCVWFESREEAEALLLKFLLAGRALDAWFWKLAVPTWRGQPVGWWIGECVSEALALSQDRRLLRIAQTCIEAAALDVLIEAIATISSRSPEPHIAQSAPDPPLRQARPPGGETEDAIALVAADTERSLPPSMKRVIMGLMRAEGAGLATGQAIVRGWLLRRSPVLALAPLLLAETLARALKEIASPGALHKSVLRRAEIQAPLEPGAAAMAPTQKRDPDVGSVIPQGNVHGTREGRRSSPAESSELEALREDDLAEPSAHLKAHLRHSDHAGLWLVVPSLVQLGFREWLLDRPELLSINPGGLLILEIARHHRICADDPALLVLGDLPQPDQRPEWARLWRHGLDRWLRRIVRRRLHDLVNRPGRIALAELALTVHYPDKAADIALRRQALDRDPGWTDWLGLSIRYHFGGTEEWP